MKKKKICIIYTGGTIGMVQSDRGYMPEPTSFRTTLERIPDLNHPDAPLWDLVQFEPLLDSSDMTVREWNKIGEAIAERYNDYEGFVILHGTDTMG